MNRQIDNSIQSEGDKPRESIEESGSNMANRESKSRKEPQQHALEARRESNRSLPALSIEDSSDASLPIQKRAPDGSPARGSAIKQKRSSRATIDSVKNSPSSLPESKTPPKPEADQEGGEEEDKNKKDDFSKSDRSKLRKGKWMVEEEEYTSRTIQHFSAGLLTLPEGATLRSYLADKLNCDPMRITKKFTGACCLGRRVYNSRDRPQASHAETEMAKAEMDHLEKRFRMRVENDQSGVPLARRQEMLLAERPTGVSTLHPIQNAAAAPWLQSFPTTTAMSAKKPSTPLNFDGNLARGTPKNTTNNNGWPFATTVPSAPGQWVLQNSAEAALSSAPAQTQSDQSLQALNSILTQLAWAQAAANLTPAISQLAVTNLQQQQLRAAFEEQLKAGASTVIVPEVAVEAAKPPAQNVSNQDVSPADQLRQGYEAHLKSLQKLAPVQVKPEPVASASSASLQTTTNQHASLNPTSKRPNNPHSAVDKQQSDAMEIVPKLIPSPPQREAENDMKSHNDTSGNKATETAKTEQASTDEEAGTILFGFLNSLRESYESAIDPEATVIPDGLQEKAGKDSSDNVKYQVDSKRENGAIQSATPISPLAASTLFQKAVAITGQRRPASVTDTSMSRSESSSRTSSQPNESSSSMDDSDSKSDNQDPSSIEESENYPVPQRSHGPPRKRHKACTDRSTLSRSERSSGASSQPNESSSSMDDSDSKSDTQDPSSSEESEKDCHSPVPQRSQGPPRKRHKAHKKIQEFTTQNVLEHSKRMKYKFDRPRNPDKY